MKTYNDGIEHAINVIKPFIQTRPKHGIFANVNAHTDNLLNFIIKELRKEQENGR